MKIKTNKTKNLRRLALAAALLLILALLLVFDAINGDPLSQQWAIHRAIRYAEKLYPEETFHWDQRTAPGGQFFHYVVYVQSDQSRDTNFAVQTRFWLLTDDEIRGKELEPDHVFYVDHRWTTAYRLGDEAAQQAAAYLTVQAPELNFASVYGAKGNTVEIDLCYTEQDGMTPANYVDDLRWMLPLTKPCCKRCPAACAHKCCATASLPRRTCKPSCTPSSRCWKATTCRSPITTSPLCPPAITLTTARLWRMCWNPA